MPLPGTWNTVTVTATFLKPDGTPATGNVQFVAVRAVGMDDTIVLPHPIVATLNGSGQMTASLPCPDDVGAGFTTLVYGVKERTQYGRDAYFIELDNAMTSVELEHVPRVDSVPPKDWYATLEGIAAEAAASAAVAQAYGPDMVGRMDALEAEDLPERVDVLEAGQSSGQRIYRTWAELNAVVGAVGNGAQVIDDAGTHTDPVVGGTKANAGQYVWSASPAGWRWVRADLPTDLQARTADLEGKWDNVAGIKNGWPDPFFRKFDLTSETLLGRDRWYWNNVGAGAFVGWSRVTNAVFDGYALRRAADIGVTPLNGPSVMLDEIGAVAGDTITVYALFTGSGAVVSFPAKFNNGSQLDVPSNVSGGSTITASTTPQWLRYQVVVPSGAVSLDTYPYTNTAGQTFDLVSLWAFKGTATRGPSWPTLPGLTDLTLADHETRIKANEAAKARTDYVVENYGVVSAAGTVVAMDGTGFGTAPRDLVFMGWGERYMPAGVSFNAVRIKSIARASAATAKWRTLGVVVRTGTNAHNAAAPVVAVGTIAVRSVESLVDVSVLLKDPITGAVKTVTDADFSGGEYFIGVYALTDTGTPAACGEPRGTLANSIGQSYYHVSSTNLPITGGWVATTSGSNLRLGFQHLMLTSPTESVVNLPSQQFANDMGGLLTVPAPDIVMPAYLYGVQGREMNVYFDNLHLADASEYLHDVTTSSAVGAHQNERWTYTPAGALAAGTFVYSAHDKRTGTSLVSKTAQLRAAASTAGTGTTKKVMVIGDSLVGAGTITQTLLDNADGMGVTLLGTLGTGLNKHEGRGGWSITTYTTNYAGNPFWIGGQVDFPGYLAANTVDTPDWVLIHLGINDCFGQTSDAACSALADSLFTSLDTLIASIKAAGAGVKVGLLIPSPPSFDQDSFGANYTTAQNRWRFKRNILIWARQLIAKYAGQEANRIYIVPSNVNLDTVNNMSRAAAAPINSRTTLTSQRQNNGVHPATEGYRQIGDAVWAFLKFYA